MIDADKLVGFLARISNMNWKVELQRATLEDHSLFLILDYFNKAAKTPASVAKKFNEYSLEDGTLYYQDRIIIPDNKGLKGNIMREHHELPETGHQGQAGTLEIISRVYYWLGMKVEINCFVSACDTCQ